MSLPAASVSVSVVVVGGGLAGLRCARGRAAAGASVLVLDKGRAPGGRMSTRRVGDAAWDHGVHRFEARDPAFVAACERWAAAGVAKPDSGGWRGMPYAASVVEHEVAGAEEAGVEVRFGVEVTEVVRLDGRGWRVAAVEPNGGRLEVDASEVVLACPPPQAAALLRGTGHGLAGVASSVPMVARWALLAEVRGGDDLGVGVRPPLERVDSRPLAGLDGDGLGGLAVVGRPVAGWSERHRELAKPEAAERLAAGLVVRGGAVVGVRVHRWLYAAVDDAAGFERRVCWSEDGVTLCGDAYAGRGLRWGVESAWLSGEAAGARGGSSG